MSQETGIRDRLSSEHDRLQGCLQQLLYAAEGATEPTVVEVWADFESTLLGHLEAEERHLFPRFEDAHPREIDELRSSHARIRELVSALGVRVELHELRLEDVGRLAVELHEHAEQEDAGLYRWAETVPHEAVGPLFDHLDGQIRRRIAEAHARRDEAA